MHVIPNSKRQLQHFTDILFKCKIYGKKAILSTQLLILSTLSACFLLIILVNTTTKSATFAIASMLDSVSFACLPNGFVVVGSLELIPNCLFGMIFFYYYILCYVKCCRNQFQSLCSLLVQPLFSIYATRKSSIYVFIFSSFIFAVLRQKHASVGLSVPQKEYRQFICLFIWIRVEWEEMEMSSGCRGLLTLNKICEFFCQ